MKLHDSYLNFTIYILLLLYHYFLLANACKYILIKRPTFRWFWAFYVIVIHDLQKVAALLIGLIDWTIALGGG